MIDVDVDLVGNVDVGCLAAEAELAAEDEQQDQDHDDEQDDGKHSAASATAAGIDYRGAFAFHTVVVGHEGTPCCLLLLRNERTAFRAVPRGGWNEDDRCGRA